MSRSNSQVSCNSRAVGRSENPRVPVVMRGIICLLVEIGLTDLPRSGGALASPAPPGATGLSSLAVAATMKQAQVMQATPKLYHKSNTYKLNFFLSKTRMKMRKESLYLK